MSEGILLPAAPRGVLLAPGVRFERARIARPQIEAVLGGETDAVAIQATLATLLFQLFVQASWVGFYRRTSPRELTVGPYQGSMGCLRIVLDRGVCGAAAREKRTQLVPDVSAFPGHIACDGAARSELVVPVVDQKGEVRAVMDLDSHLPAAFDAHDAAWLEGLLATVFADAAW